ncbi:DMT family transporter [Vibrio sp. SCSIO 43136]|uniref:DMT family transporter n=1 Tax=Vibrio sp. SCSIO 43136 TaxID=2819101 RepID=UPI002075B2AF|nr:DMT family transporter [Vibrio sp. SCSIO 43136]USD64261.1 DMT family transporter [Vibrio sp. SCSIO 43136]
MSQAANQAIFLLVIANLLASLSDVSLKILNGEVPTFQYVFIRQTLTVLILLPLWLKLPRVERMQGCGKINFWRAQFILMGSACALIALTYLPLATANAMFYVGPILMLPLSILVLKESPTRGKVIATLIGFFGVLIVLRPDHFHWAAIAALGSALAMGIGNILIKRLPQDQHIISTLFWTSVLTLPVSLVLAIREWSDISLTHLGWITAVNLFVLGYHALVVMAYKKAPANQIALAEYSGLVFVTTFGVMWFDEIPDALTLVGILLIVVPMMPIQWRKLISSDKKTSKQTS